MSEEGLRHGELNSSRRIHPGDRENVEVNDLFFRRENGSVALRGVKVGQPQHCFATRSIRMVFGIREYQVWYSRGFTRVSTRRCLVAVRLLSPVSLMTEEIVENPVEVDWIDRNAYHGPRSGGGVRPMSCTAAKKRAWMVAATQAL